MTVSPAWLLTLTESVTLPPPRRGRALVSGHFHFNAQGIAKEHRFDEFPLVDFPKGQHVGAQNAGLDGQAGGHRQPQNAVRDALAEGAWRVQVRRRCGSG